MSTQVAGRPSALPASTPESAVVAEAAAPAAARAKMSGTVARLAQQGANASVEVVVNTADANALLQALERQGLTVDDITTYAQLPMVALRVPAQQLDELATLAQTSFISLNDTVEAASLGSANARQANYVVSNVPSPTDPDAVIPNSNLGVAVLDSGVDRLMSWDLDSFVQQINFVTAQCGNNWWEASYGCDPYGHGTHVASLIVGDGTDSHGYYAGIGGPVKLYSLRVLDHKGRGKLSDTLAALDWVLTNGPANNIKIV
ncbi:MAG: S8 family serine peptidase, partial [Pseudomonadota bacterium]